MPVTGADRPGHGRLRVWQSREVQWSAASGALLAAGYLGSWVGLSDTAATAIWIVSVLAGARFFAIEAMRELFGKWQVDIELLMTVATITAGALGLWEEAAALAFLYSISEALEEFTEDKTRGAIEALMDLAPKRVTRLTEHGDEEIELEQLAVGDQFRVRPGESVATDGIVESGKTSLDESAITGESIPVEKSPDDQVFAGTLNTTGALIVRATTTSAENTLAKIVSLVAEAQEAKGRSEQFLTRFARVYSPAVLLSGAVVAVVGGTVTDDWGTWIERAATVIVAAAPCALVISVPITYVAAIGNASRRGILIKGGIYLEELAQVRVIALDKTGTLTRGEPAVVAAHCGPGVDEATLLGAAAAVEIHSEHPLATAIVAAARVRSIDPLASTQFRAMTGAGAEATINGRRVSVTSPQYATEHDIDLDGLSPIVPREQREGRTVVVIVRDHRPLGILAIADMLRPGARDAMATLHRYGIERLVMLTGDNKLTAERIGAAAGINEVEAELSPADKARLVADMAAETHVAMVGDGVNDAPALAAASVGIAMGTAGSDVALETADVALMADDLTKLTTALDIGRRTRRVVHQNLMLGIGILVLLVPGALAGLFALPIAVLAHELSELVVILNGTRLARTNQEGLKGR